MTKMKDCPIFNVIQALLNILYRTSEMMQPKTMQLAVLTQEQQSKVLNLNAMYSRQNPAYLTYIKKKEQQVQIFSEDIQWSFRWKLRTVRINFDQRQKKQVRGQTKEDKISDLDQIRQQGVKYLKLLNKWLQGYQQQVNVFIFMEWRNFERAKEEDDTLSSELANMTTQEVKEIAGFRYSIFHQALKSCEKYRQKLEELFSKHSYY